MSSDRALKHDAPPCPATRKLAFVSRKEARRHIKTCRGQYGHRHNALYVYCCPHCGLWHTTSQEQH